jgi:hypothetical protein
MMGTEGVGGHSAPWVGTILSPRVISGTVGSPFVTNGCTLKIIRIFGAVIDVTSIRVARRTQVSLSGLRQRPGRSYSAVVNPIGRKQRDVYTTARRYTCKKPRAYDNAEYRFHFPSQSPILGRQSNGAGVCSDY